MVIRLHYNPIHSQQSSLEEYHAVGSYFLSSQKPSRTIIWDDRFKILERLSCTGSENETKVFEFAEDGDDERESLGDEDT